MHNTPLQWHLTTLLHRFQHIHPITFGEPHVCYSRAVLERHQSQLRIAIRHFFFFHQQGAGKHGEARRAEHDGRQSHPGRVRCRHAPAALRQGCPGIPVALRRPGPAQRRESPVLRPPVAAIAAGTQAELTKAAETQLAETNSKVISLVDEMSKNAPAGSENVVAAFKASLGNANAGYEQFSKTAKQAAQAIETNVNAAVNQFTQAAQTMATKAAAK